jgi:hypothetical protein
LSAVQWVDVGVPTVTGNNATSPDGTTTAARIATTSATNAFGRYNPHTYLAAAYTLSVFGKAGTYNYLAVDFSNASNLGAVFDLSNGTIGFTDAGITSTIKAYPNGWYRCTITGTMAAGANFPEVYLSGSRTANTRSWTGNGTQNLYVWGAQLEAGSFASSYIPTTTAAVVRNADILTYPFSGNASASVGSAYAELSTQWTTSTAAAAVAFSVAEACLWCPGTVADTTIRILDGLNSGIKTGLTNMSTASRKRASSWGGSTISVTGDGAAVASNSFDGGMGSNAVGIGNFTDGSANWFGTIRNVRIYSTQLSASQLQAVTS